MSVCKTGGILISLMDYINVNFLFAIFLSVHYNYTIIQQPISGPFIPYSFIFTLPCPWISFFKFLRQEPWKEGMTGGWDPRQHYGSWESTFILGGLSRTLWKVWSLPCVPCLVIHRLPPWTSGLPPCARCPNYKWSCRWNPKWNPHLPGVPREASVRGSWLLSLFDTHFHPEVVRVVFTPFSLNSS